MANIITKTKVIDGPRTSLIHVYFESDGIEGNLDNYVLLDPVVDFGLTTEHQLCITQVWYSLVWFDALLKFNALSNSPSWMFSRATDANYIDFRYFSGLKDWTTAEHTGKLLISTANFDAAGSVGTMLIEVKKNLRNVVSAQ